VLIPSTALNPEDSFYYQHFDFVNDYKGIKEDTSKPLLDKCEKKDTSKLIEEFNPSDPSVQEMWKTIEQVGLKKIIAVEVDHCPQSYGCLLVT
jgi:hypothetical protein